MPVELAKRLFTAALMTIIILVSLHISLVFLRCLVINLFSLKMIESVEVKIRTDPNFPAFPVQLLLKRSTNWSQSQCISERNVGILKSIHYIYISHRYI